MYSNSSFYNDNLHFELSYNIEAIKPTNIEVNIFARSKTWQPTDTYTLLNFSIAFLYCDTKMEIKHIVLIKIHIFTAACLKLRIY